MHENCDESECICICICIFVYTFKMWHIFLMSLIMIQHIFVREKVFLNDINEAYMLNRTLKEKIQINIFNWIITIANYDKKFSFKLCSVLVTLIAGQRAYIESLMANNATIREGKRLRIVCKVRGHPPPKVTWFKDDKSINKNRLRYQFVHLRWVNDFIID